MFPLCFPCESLIPPSLASYTSSYELHAFGPHRLLNLQGSPCALRGQGHGGLGREDHENKNAGGLHSAQPGREGGGGHKRRLIQGAVPAPPTPEFKPYLGWFR